MMFIALGQKYFLAFLKVHSLAHCFSIFLRELFMVIPNYGITNYVSDNTPYSTRKKIAERSCRFKKDF